jgi:hypothetical protein
MATNRYSKPAQQTIMDTHVAMPYKEMLLAGQAQQTQLDELDANRIALGDKEFYNLEKDDEKAAAAREWLSTESAKIADLYGTNMGGAKSAYRNLEREAKKRFGQSGDIGAMDANYKAKMAYKEKLEAAGADPLRIEGLMREASEAYEGIGKGGEYGRYNTYGGQRAANNYNYTDWATTNLSDLEAMTDAYATVNPDGKGYIWKSKGTNEVVSSERINQAAMQLAQGDENLMYNIAEGDRLGMNSTEAFLNAIGGADTKYAYHRKTRDKSMTSDATALRAMDKADEVEANRVNHISVPGEYVNMGDSDINFVADMKNDNTKLEEAQTNIDAIKEELQDYYLRDENGDVEFDDEDQPAVNPDFTTNYKAAMNNLITQQRIWAKAKTDLTLKEKTYAEAVQEVYPGSDISGRKIQKILDNGNLLLEDKDVVVGFLDEQGNQVTLSDANYSSRINVDTKAKKDKLWADATSKGLTPVYDSEIIDIYDKDKLSQIKTNLNNRKAMSEDFMIDEYVTSDFELSPQTEALRESLIDNMGFGFDIMVKDKNNRYVKADMSKVRDKVKEYSSLKSTEALQKVSSDYEKNEISENDKNILLKLIQLNRQREGSEAFRENTKLIGTVKGPNGFAILEDPNGNRMLLKPKDGAVRESYNRAVQNSDKQIYVATGDEMFKARGLAFKYPDKYNELMDLKKDISEQISKTKGENLMKQPLYLNNGYYLHSVRGKNAAMVQVFLSKSGALKNQPGPEDTDTEQVELSKIDQIGLNFMELASTITNIKK